MNLGTRRQRHEIKRAAGLIDEAVRQRMVAFEAFHCRPLLLWSLSGLAVLALIAGLSTVVAAHWQDIPAQAKLVGHGAINAVVAITIALLPRTRPVLNDLMLSAKTALTLTLIALFGQIFELQGPLWLLLVLWSALITPLLLVVGRTILAASLWLLMLAITLASTLFPLLELLAPLELGLSLIVSLPPLCLLLARLAARTPVAPAFIVSLEHAGWAGFLILVAYAQWFWHGGTLLRNVDPSSRDIALIITITLVAAVGSLRCEAGQRQARIGLLLGGTTLGLLPFIAATLTPRVADGAFSAFAVIGFVLAGLLAAWAAARCQRRLLIALAALAIAWRILHAVDDALGSLLLIGIGLAGTGAVILLMVMALNHSDVLNCRRHRP